MALTKDGAVSNLAIPPIDAAAPAMTETATFGLGCFWDPDSRFGSISGVVRTRVGYVGSGKTEVIQVDYDPTQTAYEALLEIFWDSHDPRQRTWNKHYMTAVFFHSDRQKKLAMETRARQATKIKGKVFTEVVAAPEFQLAEAYHQKYRLRQTPDLMQEFEAIYPDTGDFIASTAAARVNGYIGGYGSRAALHDFGLTAAGEKKLLDIVKS